MSNIIEQTKNSIIVYLSSQNIQAVQIVDVIEKAYHENRNGIPINNIKTLITYREETGEYPKTFVYDGDAVQDGSLMNLLTETAKIM